MKDRRVRYSDDQLVELIKIATERLGLDAVIDAADAVPHDPFGHDYCIIPTTSNLAIGEHKSEGAAMQAATSYASQFHTDVRVARIISCVDKDKSISPVHVIHRPQVEFAKSYAIITLCLMLLTVIFLTTARFLNKSEPMKIEYIILIDGVKCKIIDRNVIDCEDKQ